MNETSKASFWQRYHKPIWISLALLALATASLLTYILFFRNTAAPELPYLGDLRVRIEAPQESTSGSEVLYRITLLNQSNVKLTNLKAEVFYPRGFTFLNSSPDRRDSLEEARNFALPELERGEQYELAIIGRLEGSVQDLKLFQVRVHYVPQNFRSPFAAESRAVTLILAPQLTLRLVAPPSLVSGQTANFEMQITNLSSSSFAEVVVRATFPGKFEFRSANPPPLRDSPYEWTIGSLEAREAKTIAVTGRLTGNPGEESFTEAELFLKDSEGELISAGRSFGFTQILASPLRLVQKVSGGAGQELKDAVVSAGQTLRYELLYENTAPVVLRNVKLAVVFENPETVDATQLLSLEGQFQNGAVVFIPGSSPELLNVRPGAQGKFEFTIPVSSKLEERLQKNPEVRTRAEFTAQDFPEALSAGNPLDLKIGTKLSLTAEVKITGGANPPTAGAPTTYKIELLVTNSVNDVADAEFLATIPRAETGFDPESLTPPDERDNLTFSPAAGTLRWQMNKLFAFSGSFHAARKLSFRLTASPGPSDFNNLPVLLKDLQVLGTDEFTGAKVVSNKIENLSAPR